MLPEWLAIVSVGIRLVSGGQYARGVLKGKASPNPVTWFLWGLTPLIAFFAEIHHGFSGQSAVLLALSITPLIIAGLGVKICGLRRYLTPFTLGCGAIALLGIVLWRITALPELAIIFCILADIFATLPTLQKAYHDRSSEYGLPYLISALSMAITLLAISSWAFTVYAFPLYMLLINVTLLSFAVLPLKKTAQSLRLHLVRQESETI